MDQAITRALARSQLIDITTTGRRTGEPRRIEIALHSFGGRLYISGMPNPARTRAWLRNLEADPRLTLHLKEGLQADVAATARVIADPSERRDVLEEVATAWGRTDLDAMVAYSPLIEVTVEEDPAEADAA